MDNKKVQIPHANFLHVKRLVFGAGKTLCDVYQDMVDGKVDAHQFLDKLGEVMSLIASANGEIATQENVFLDGEQVEIAQKLFAAMSATDQAKLH